MKRIALPWTTVFAFTTGANYRFIPASGWLNAASVKNVRGTFEVVSPQTYLSVTFAYQTANVEDTPDTARSVGSALTTEAMSYGTVEDISAYTFSKQLVRFGWLVQNTNAASLIVGRVGGMVEYNDC